MANQLVSEYFDALAKQSGIDRESDGWKLFLSDPKLHELYIDTEFIEKMQSSFMTFESAKNNSELQKHFTGAVLGGIDNALKRALKTIGAPEDIRKILESQETTLKKSESIIEALKEHYEKSPTDPDTEKILKENKELASKVNELTETVNTFPSQIEKAQNELIQKHESELMGYNVMTRLNKYNFNSTLPREDINLIVSNKIKDLPYILKKEGNDLKVYQKEHPDLLAQQDNKEVTVDGILDSIVSPYVAKESSNGTQETRTVETPTEAKGSQTSLQAKMEAQASGGRKPALG